VTLKLVSNRQTCKAKLRTVKDNKSARIIYLVFENEWQGSGRIKTTRDKKEKIKAPHGNAGRH
jgi:hypothetical protein